MKAISSLLSVLVFASTAVFGQGGTVITSAPTIEAAISNSTSALDASLTRLLEQAEQQNQKLQSTLDRMGDPAAVNLPSVEIIKNDIMQSATALKTRDEQRSALASLTGAEVFTTDAQGLMQPIGDSFEKKDGTTAQRDPEKYRMESGLQSQVTEYNQVREKALERKKALMDEIHQVTLDIQEATDLASIQKSQAMLTLLYGQVEECNQSIHIAQGDTEMFEREIVSQARVQSKAKTEEAEANSPRAAAGSAGTGTATFPGLGGTPRNLPWGRKGSETNPGSGSSGTGSSTGTGGGTEP